MSALSNLIQSEIADFFAGFGGPGEPDIQSGEAQRQLTERVLDLLNKEREAAVPVRYMNRYTGSCYTLEQQPDAATDTAVYVPLYDVAQPVAVPDENSSAFREFAISKGFAIDEGGMLIGLNGYGVASMTWRACCAAMLKEAK